MGWENYGTWDSADSLRLNPYLKPEGSGSSCGFLSGLQATINDKYKMNLTSKIKSIDILSPLTPVYNSCASIRSYVYQMLSGQDFIDATQAVDGGFDSFDYFPYLTVSRVEEILDAEIMATPTNLGEIRPWAYQMYRILNLMRWKTFSMSLTNKTASTRLAGTFRYPADAEEYWSNATWQTCSSSANPGCYSSYPYEAWVAGHLQRVRATMDISIKNISMEKKVLVYVKPSTSTSGAIYNDEVYPHYYKLNYLTEMDYATGDLSVNYTFGDIDTIPAFTDDYEESILCQWVLPFDTILPQALVKFDGPNGAEFRGPDWDT